LLKDGNKFKYKKEESDEFDKLGLSRKSKAKEIKRI